MLSEKEKFLKYWIPFAEKVYMPDSKVEEKNYLMFKDNSKKRIIRYINGKTVNIIGNLFGTKKHHDEVLEIFCKIFMRYTKEYHMKWLINKLKNNHKNFNMDFFANLTYYYPNFGEMLKLYFFKLR